MVKLSLKQKPVHLLIFVTLAFLISVPMVLPRQAAAQTDGYYNKSFAWDYNGKHWTWNLSIPQSLYDAYKEVPVSTRTRDGPAGYGFLTTTQDYYVKTLAQKLNETATQQGYNSYDQVSFVLAFVQSLPYTSDNVTEGYNEYPRFPIETLIDDGGDCEDTSILFASLTLIMGYGTVYINPPDHYAVGILGNNLKGTYWTHPENSNKTYYYCETTGDGFKIGQLPDEFLGQSAFIYDIDESKQYIPDVIVVPPSEPTPTDLPSETSPTATLQAPPTDSASPTIAQPSVQPVLPLSFNLIADNPVLFVIIALAVVVSIGVTVWSIRKPKQLQKDQPTQTEQSNQQTQDTAVEGAKFCVYCGSSNKAFAVFCEKCGKQINQQSV
jgi:hypothetical protein